MVGFWCSVKNAGKAPKYQGQVTVTYFNRGWDSDTKLSEYERTRTPTQRAAFTAPDENLLNWFTKCTNEVMSEHPKFSYFMDPADDGIWDFDLDCKKLTFCRVRTVAINQASSC